MVQRTARSTYYYAYLLTCLFDSVETVADYEDPIEKNLLKMGFMFDVFETENKTSQRILLRYDETQLRSEDESLISSKIVSEVNDKVCTFIFCPSFDAFTSKI